MTKKIGINELNPRESSFTFKGKTFNLKKFSLAVQVWADSEFRTSEQSSGLLVLSDKLRELDTAAIAKMSYYLLRDKSELASPEELLDFFGNEHKFLASVLPAVVESIGVSQPTSDDVTAEEIELKK